MSLTANSPTPCCAELESARQHWKTDRPLRSRAVKGTRRQARLGFSARGRRGRPVLPRFAVRRGLRGGAGKAANSAAREGLPIFCAAGLLCCGSSLVALLVRWPKAFPSGPSSHHAGQITEVRTNGLIHHKLLFPPDVFRLFVSALLGLLPVNAHRQPQTDANVHRQCPHTATSSRLPSTRTLRVAATSINGACGTTTPSPPSSRTSNPLRPACCRELPRYLGPRTIARSTCSTTRQWPG